MGGKSRTKTEIPEWVKGPAEANLHRAMQAGQMGYVPHYGPSAAAFSPLQLQGFANTGSAAQAFGMAPQGETFQPTMQPTDFGNGLRAHSSGPLFDLALAELQQRRPGQFDAINSTLLDPITGKPPAPPPGMAAVGVPGAGAPAVQDMAASSRDRSWRWLP